MCPSLPSTERSVTLVRALNTSTTVDVNVVRQRYTQRGHRDYGPSLPWDLPLTTSPQVCGPTPSLPGCLGDPGVVGSVGPALDVGRQSRTRNLEPNRRETTRTFDTETFRLRPQGGREVHRPQTEERDGIVGVERPCETTRKYLTGSVIRMLNKLLFLFFFSGLVYRHRNQCFGNWTSRV